MPRPANISSMEDLTAILDLERLEENLFRGDSPDVGWQRVFGGLVISQALVAASRTVTDDRHIHSLHAYFLRPGDPAVPIIYEVDRIRDGKSFATRRVVAIQHGRPIFSLSASFQVDEEGFVHQFALPDVPDPDVLLGGKDIYEIVLKGAPEHVERFWRRQSAFDILPVSLTHYISSEKLEPKQHVWVRPKGKMPENRALRAAIIAYLSDMTLIDTALFPHGVSIFDKAIQGASLDHAMWFSAPAELDDWFLYAQDSPFSEGARGLSRGNIFNRSGALIVSVAQEGLIRKRATD